MTRWGKVRRRVMPWLAAVMVVVSLVGGPYFAAYEATKAAEHTKASQEQLAALVRTEAGVENLLRYVARVQADRRTNDLIGYLVAELEALCNATKGCRNVVVPGSLGG